MVHTDKRPRFVWLICRGYINAAGFRGAGTGIKLGDLGRRPNSGYQAAIQPTRSLYAVLYSV